MTVSKACEIVLKELGGRACLKDIYPRVFELVKLGGDTPRNTIRSELQRHPKLFRKSPDKPDGWWELLSFQEEIAIRDQRIKELEEENERLKDIKTEDDFVSRLVRETKKLYKHEKGKIEVIRQILYKVGRSDAEAELDAWIEGREYKPSVNIAGDYVVNKNVDNEVNGVTSGGTGINVNIRRSVI